MRRLPTYKTAAGLFEATRKTINGLNGLDFSRMAMMKAANYHHWSGRVGALNRQLLRWEALDKEAARVRGQLVAAWGAARATYFIDRAAQAEKGAKS